LKGRIKDFGWRGFLLKIPETWDLTREQIKKKNGFLQIEDEYGVRIEVNWEKIPFEKMPDVKNTMKKIIENLKKKNPKLKAIGRVNVKVMNHDAILSRINLDEENCSDVLHWYCENSERLCTLFLYSTTKDYEKYHSFLSKTILPSLKCHGEKYFWNFYGIKLTLPSTFDLTYYKVTTGLSLARFYRRKDNAYILLAYNSMANIILKEYYNNLEDWYDATLRKDVDKFFGKFGKIKREDAIVSGHKAIQLVSQRGIPLPFVKKTKRMRIFLWHCEKSNRLYAIITVFSEEKASERYEAQNIIRNLKCH